MGLVEEYGRTTQKKCVILGVFRVSNLEYSMFQTWSIPCFKLGVFRVSNLGYSVFQTWSIPCFKLGVFRVSNVLRSYKPCLVPL